MTSAEQEKTVCIIGGGISGLIACDVLQRLGFAPTVFEKATRIGGIWELSAYPNVSTQNTAEQYTIPDFPWPTKPNNYPTGPEILNYLTTYVKTRHLNVKTNCEVVRVRQMEDNHWEVVINEGEDTKKQYTVNFAYLVVATGQFSSPKSSNPIFNKNNFKNIIVTERDVVFSKNISELFANRSVVVIGFGKTALDFCSLAVNQKAKSVSHVFNAPRWIIPRTIFGIGYSHFLFMRNSTLFMPSWGHPTYFEEFLHQFFGIIVNLFWSFLQVLFRFEALKFAKSDSKKKERIEQVLPKNLKLQNSLRSALPVDTEPISYFQLIGEGKIIPIQGKFEGFITENAIRVSKQQENNKFVEVQADVVVLCCGSEAPSFGFFEDIKFREKLEKETGGVQLYRHIFHPEIQNFGVIGYSHSFIHTATTLLSTILLASVWRGETQLPSIKEMNESIKRIQNYKDVNILYEPSRSCAVNTRFQQYCDVLSADLGISTWRKFPNLIAEFFARYGGADYDGVIDEYLEARKRDPKLIMHCSKIDM